ncbi:hypothetical protein [Streptomyces sp. CBMA29]|uniref:hypothetical protein n=1 Tax=Streptomyces sp. CBMA29 TaxID=1896314 RepID=UPI001CB70E44|nr:hypothetical protein [Streptomyces sp. CBMA29]
MKSTAVPDLPGAPRAGEPTAFRVRSPAEPAACAAPASSSSRHWARAGWPSLTRNSYTSGSLPLPALSNACTFRKLVPARVGRKVTDFAAPPEVATVWAVSHTASALTP